jgi:hypothetical protein
MYDENVETTASNSTTPLLGLDKWAPTNIYEFTCPAKVLKIGE